MQMVPLLLFGLIGASVLILGPSNAILAWFLGNTIYALTLSKEERDEIDKM